MQAVVIQIIVLLIVVALLLSIVLLVSSISSKSLRLKKIITLNSCYQSLFIAGNKIQAIQCRPICKSKAALTKFNLHDYAILEIQQKLGFYTNAIHQAVVCQTEYDQYLTERKKITMDNTLETYRFSIFSDIENLLISRHFPKLKSNLQMQIIASYTSPKGRNRYTKKHTYSLSDMKQLRQQAVQKIEQKKTRQHSTKVERAKMSDGLRYDILKRDNFRCRICGASSRDGVQLHVDHIHPVSKGGKTTHSNLQTLCDRCNLGKSNKV